jgi:hypothetical protein
LDFKPPIVPISISFDSIKKLQIFENMYVFGWDYFKREPPYLWNPNYTLSSEDTSRVIYNSFESRKSKVLNIETTNILLDTSNKTIIMEGFVTGGWYGAGSIVNLVVGEIIDTLIPQYEMSFSPKMDREYIQERKRKNKPLFDAFLVGFYMKDFDDWESGVGFENEKERYFKIRAYINNKSVLVFGLNGNIAEIFEIGKLLPKYSKN